ARIAALQARLDEFVEEYNSSRPHSSLKHKRTPEAAYLARPKATPSGALFDPHRRVRHDRVDDAGKVTLRINGELHGIGIGRRHARTRIILLVQDLDVRVVDATTGELLGEQTIDLAKRYHGTGKPPGPPPKSPTLIVSSGVSYVLRHHIGADDGIRTRDPHLGNSTQATPLIRAYSYRPKSGRLSRARRSSQFQGMHWRLGTGWARWGCHVPRAVEGVPPSNDGISRTSGRQRAG